MTRQIAVIGGGPAGVEAALAAARAGARVTLVSEGPIGGRAGWASLVPSKVWIAAAEAASAGGPPVDPPAILARIGAVSAAWGAQQAAALAELEVAVIQGVAAFAGPGRLSVRDGAGLEVATLQPDATIIAAGSAPRFPPDMRPDGRRVIAPRFANTIAQLPPDIVVVGGGVTGSEFASLFSLLGVRVTWVVGPKGVLPEFAPESGQMLAEALRRRGVEIRQGQRAVRVEHGESGVAIIAADGARHPASMAFLAVGRSPDLGRLNLAAVGLDPAAGPPPADGLGRTAAEGVYLVGDAAGGPMLANRAMAQAWAAGRHAAGADAPAFCADAVIHAAYCDPQVAQVGQVNGPDTRTVRLPLSAALKSHLSGAGEGYVALSYDPDSRQVRGGAAVGAHAADILAPVAMAIQHQLPVDALAATFAANPTMSELAFMAARAALV
ncbi:FAD-dependent oxidoreductase [Oscillochloris sp. ZM17-4]|uniref:FAD-dependent oxidoreductase n=1 Tax=Oscillochloris sp. ZM17-4 TaxID=2866714 RepID=UPI001C731322|nr:FAD-dependent oxidoreductase [Oscillochloris sp. ZM17-4]MBX0330928.1 FAD-dependent oxidoreductase [Oscillochloris sp. ZM17-4]